MLLASNFIARVWKSAVGWSFAVTALRAGGFLLVLPIALRRLSPDELGLWYVFTSIGDFCAFAELGLALILGRSASFFMAGIERLPVRGLELSPPTVEMRAPNLAGLAGLLRLAQRVYVRIVAGILLFMLTVGLAIVLSKLRALPGPQTNHWLTYGVFVVATVLSVAGSYWPQFLVGIGQVRLGQRALLAGLALNYAVAACCLWLGFGILSLAVGQLVLSLVNFTYARWHALESCPGIRTITAPEIRFGEVWPATWRSLLTSLGANMCCQGTLFVCGIISSLATTASFGLSLRLALVAQGFAGAWLVVRQPHIARARAGGDLPLAIQLVRGSVGRCFVTYGFGAMGIFLVAPLLLEWIKSRTPALPPTLLAGLLVMVGLDFLVGFHSAVIQTANRFPHLKVYLLSGLGTVALAFALGREFGVAGIIGAPIVAQVWCAYWWIPRRAWFELLHAQASRTDDPLHA